MNETTAPFPWFGGKSRAASLAWGAFGRVANYVEPFAGSAAVLLAAPAGQRTETINDIDGFVANFWRAVAADPDALADAADWPCNEIDLEARHSWLVREAAYMNQRLRSCPDYFDARIAGWWCWGQCNWIGGGWCSGDGPWIHDGEWLVDSRQLPHLGNAGQGINRKLPRLSDGRGDEHPRSAFIRDWIRSLSTRLRDVRVACGDWTRVLSESVTVRHGVTAVFLDPPYTVGDMDYTGGGTGGGVAADVRAWCADNGNDSGLRIVLCGHAGEHESLQAEGWSVRRWKARKGYALKQAAKDNAASETIWCSPHCELEIQSRLFI